MFAWGICHCAPCSPYVLAILATSQIFPFRKASMGLFPPKPLVGIGKEVQLHPGIDRTQGLQYAFETIECLAFMELEAGIAVPTFSLCQCEQLISTSGVYPLPGGTD